uniref:Uncharacterized protein TCIL3000_11_14830 n=1 Tax=Trypanosoma congolense (strain IL3000) TaxID=1068625 RepID=G0V2U4_TRYCI|nr:unnamed protein product [Trypanosoma congolense IL3000]
MRREDKIVKRNSKDIGAALSHCRGTQAGVKKCGKKQSKIADSISDSPLIVHNNSDGMTGDSSSLEGIAVSATVLLPLEPRCIDAELLPRCCETFDGNTNLLTSCRVSFVLSNARASNTNVGSSVYIHIYELSDGLLHRHSGKATGKYVSGLYHSAVVFCGMEFFFEGGIAISSAGRTRFGGKYKKVLAGCAVRSLGCFLHWIRRNETESYQLHSYHPTKHNCHAFTADATAFLVGPEARFPSYLTDTVDTLVSTSLGSAVAGTLVHLLNGMHFVISAKQVNRFSRRKVCLLNTSRYTDGEKGNVLPPTCVILFHVNNPTGSRRVLAALGPFVEHLLFHGVVGPNAVNTVHSVLCLSDGGESINPHEIPRYVELLALSLMCTDPRLWEPILNGARVAVLHKAVLCTLVFHPLLLNILSDGARSFMCMPVACKLAFLRLLCNLSGGVHGAVALSSEHYAKMWVSVAGLAMIDYDNLTVVYSGSALALNLAQAFVLTDHSLSTPSMSIYFPDHLLQLITILLFCVASWPMEQIPEAALDLALLALLTFITAVPSCAVFVRTHAYKLDFDRLAAVSRSRERLALVSLLRCINEDAQS